LTYLSIEFVFPLIPFIKILFGNLLVFNFNLFTKLVEIKLQKEPLSKIDSHCNFKILFLLLELLSGIIVLKIKNESDNFLLIIELNVGNV